jgi:hypothetical protein
LRKTHKIAAVGCSSLLLSLALTSAALAGAGSKAASRTVASVRISAASAARLPNTNIKGNPAKWSPSSLNAKGRWAGSPTPCTTSEGSFTETNKENKAEKVKFKATGVSGSLKEKIPAHEKFVFCITKGYHGTVTGTLSDHKKLKAHF